MRRQSGFTLLEALMAGVILFAVIASMTSLYQGALTALLKSEAAVDRATAVPFMMDMIRFDIRQEKKREGSGTIQSQQFRWKAEVIQQGGPFVPQGLEGEYQADPDKYILLQVTLWVGERPAVTFKEFTW